MEKSNKQLKPDIIAIGRLLWEKDLVSGLNGNISTRLDEQSILLTTHSTCLGLLHEQDILALQLDGTLKEPGQVSSEKLLHTEIYKNFKETQAIIHTHTVYTNAYFLKNDRFLPTTFEAKFYLGEVLAIAQSTPSVTDAKPIIEALKITNIVVLKNHGVVAIGKSLFDCFLLIQGLEEAIKVDAISRLYGNFSSSTANSLAQEKKVLAEQTTKYKLFSLEQMQEIVRLVNADSTLKDLGSKTKMTMTLAVKIDETREVYCFDFENGHIKEMNNNENAEFLISAPEKVWRAVFNREIDPFVATTQKKMNLNGDFAKISKWYAPCSRIFELWQQVPVI